MITANTRKEVNEVSDPRLCRLVKFEKNYFSRLLIQFFFNWSRQAGNLSFTWILGFSSVFFLRDKSWRAAEKVATTTEKTTFLSVICETHTEGFQFLVGFRCSP